MKFFFWVVTLIAAIVAAVVFSDLNPDPITLRFPAQSSTQVSPITLVLVCVTFGALAVTLLVWIREIRALILNWRSSRQRKREERVEAYYADGVLASLSRRSAEAISLLQKVLALEPNHTGALMSLGNIFRKEKHYNEAIRLHRKARQRDEGNLEILFTLAKDLQDAKQHEEAIQALEEVVRFDETLIHEGKLHQAAESWEKSYIKTGNPVFLQRLEDLYLKLGEPGEMIRIYQDALVRTSMDSALKLALGRLYYRLEMIDDAFELLSTLEGLFDPTGAIHKMMASLYIRKGNTEAALLEIQEGLSTSRPGCMAFQCMGCLYQTQEWSGRCPGCGCWNTIAISPATGITRASLESGHESDAASLHSVRAPFEIV